MQGVLNCSGVVSSEMKIACHGFNEVVGPFVDSIVLSLDLAGVIMDIFLPLLVVCLCLQVSYHTVRENRTPPPAAAAEEVPPVAAEIPEEEEEETPRPTHCPFCGRRDCNQCNYLIDGFGWESFEGKHHFLFNAIIENQEQMRTYIQEKTPSVEVNFASQSHPYRLAPAGTAVHYQTRVTVRKYGATKFADKQ